MFNFAIDRGGTFTDVYARLPSGETKVTILTILKLILYIALSSDLELKFKRTLKLSKWLDTS